ncbi:MAG: galactokinase family protein [Oscillospiraceae bacterium]|nr:galactokinase family protein [Oscillospiraceae bacterium]
MIKLFSPGRTELAGNHTDHQKGRVLAAAVDKGIHAQIELNYDNIVRIKSEGFADMEINILDLDVHPEEFGSSAALVRGAASAMYDLGASFGGFNAVLHSDLSSGSGLSSSAAFSVLMVRAFNELYNDSQLEAMAIAKAAQQAENLHFGKPCGLMDQLACALGRAVYIDFLTGDVQPVSADFSRMGLTLCLTDTGGSHAGLDTSYARIPADMRLVASFFGKELLGQVDPKEFYAKKWDTSDRPVRRAKHFFDENERVPKMRDALIALDGQEYMRLMNESGRSSERYLKNIVTSVTDDRKLQTGLEMSAKLLDGVGAWRVHGGGFAGCVQALMPTGFFEHYKTEMEKIFGYGSCRELKLG